MPLSIHLTTTMKTHIYATIFTIVLSSFALQSHSILQVEQLTLKTKLTKDITKFIQIYNNSNIIFHMNKRSIDIINYLPLYLQNTSFRVYNYELLQEDDDFIRPNMPNIVHLLFIDDFMPWKWMNHPGKINYNDIVIFITNNEAVKWKIMNAKLNLMEVIGNLLLLESTDEQMLLYKLCYFCGKSSGKFLLTENQNITKYNSELKLNNFRNLNHHLLKLIFIPIHPILFCKDKNKINLNHDLVTACPNLAGVEAHMLRIIAKKMHFKFRAYALDWNSSFREMLYKINSKAADLAVGGLTMSLDRRPLIEFTNQYSVEYYCFLYMSNLSFKEVFEKFLHPFKNVFAWSLFALTFVILSVMLFVVLRVNKEERYKEVPLGDCFWVCLYMPFEQSHPNINGIFRGLSSSGLVLALWWFGCMIFCTMYKSTVLSTVVHPPLTEPEDFEQLINVGYTIAANIQSKDVITEMLSVEDSLYRAAMQNIIFGENTCDVFSKVISHRVAMLDELSTILFQIQTICQEPSDYVFNLLRIARIPVRSAGHAWAMQIGAPFSQAINYYLGLILSGGLYVKWVRDDASFGGEQPFIFSREMKNSNAHALPLLAFEPLFVIYGVGLIVSIFCFILEQLYFYFYHK